MKTYCLISFFFCGQHVSEAQSLGLSSAMLIVYVDSAKNLLVSSSCKFWFVVSETRVTTNYCGNVCIGAERENDVQTGSVRHGGCRQPQRADESADAHQRSRL